MEYSIICIWVNKISFMKHYQLLSILLLSTVNVSAQTTTNNSKGEKQIFQYVELMPEFPEGDVLSYLQQNIRYPADAVQKKIEGRVSLRLLITSSGDVSDVTVIRGVDPILDEEALRVVTNMPKWKPGMQNGKTVDVYYTLPVSFRLDQTKKQK
jgi:TonB family protein